MQQLTYEYGIRLDKDKEHLVWNQIKLSRLLYSDAVAIMRESFFSMQAYIFSVAPAEVSEIKSKIEEKSEEIKAHKAAFDDKAMKKAIGESRQLWKSLYPLMKQVKKDHKDYLKEHFYDHQGIYFKKANSPIDLISKKYKAEGLGTETAAVIVNNAIKAWQDSMNKYKPPSSKKWSEITQDSLSVRYSTKGGISWDALKEKGTNLFKIENINDKYPEFEYQLCFKTGDYATGTIHLHRDLPKGSNITTVRLVRTKAANRFKWKIQFVISAPEMVIKTENRKPLVSIHLGWNEDVNGRRIAGITDEEDPSFAKILKLPDDIEADLTRADEIKGLRDTLRDEVVPKIKEEIGILGEEELDEELAKIKKLPVNHVALSRLHRFIHLCWKAEIDLPEWLIEWKSRDKINWQAHNGIAKRARNRRKNFYIHKSIELCSKYDAIALEGLNLKEAAIIIDDKGERTEFTKKARRGRTIAALFVFKEELRKQCVKYGTALFEENPKHVKSVSTCAHCHSKDIEPLEDDWHIIECKSCGAHEDRKITGVSNLHRQQVKGIASRSEQYHIDMLDKKNKAAITKAENLLKKQEGLRKKNAEKARLKNGDQVVLA